MDRGSGQRWIEHGFRAPRSGLDSEQPSSPIHAPESVPPELLGTPGCSAASAWVRDSITWTKYRVSGSAIHNTQPLWNKQPRLTSTWFRELKKKAFPGKAISIGSEAKCLRSETLTVWNFCALETGRRARESGEKGGKNWEVEQSVLVSSIMSAFPMESLGEVAKIPFLIFFLHGLWYSAAV